NGGIGLALANNLGLKELQLRNHMNAAGSFAVAQGMANHDVCVFSDAPLQVPGFSAGAYARSAPPRGMASLAPAYGIFSGNAHYALAARRHMELYGTTNDNLGAHAVRKRAWPTMNPSAMTLQATDLEHYGF